MTSSRRRTRRSGKHTPSVPRSPVEEMVARVGPDFYDDLSMADALTSDASAVAPDLPRLREAREVLALKSFDQHWIYPTWQVRDHQVIPGLTDVLAAFDGQPAWSVATWLTAPATELDDRTPVAVLDDDPDRVLDEARRTASRWAI